MSRTALFGLSLLLACSAGHALAQASNCDAIRDGIDAKIRAGGVTRFTLTVVDAGASAAGRNVGSCERGSRKIMYLQTGPAGAAPAAPAAAASAAAGKPAAAAGGVLTECKDGRVSVGGNCSK